MSQYMILTAVGNDRPGLVDQVSQYIFQRGGNIEESRMVNLRGQFAIMVLLGGEESALKRVRQNLLILQELTGLHVELRPAVAAVPRSMAEARPMKLDASAMDQPGLVHRIAHLLGAMNVNIESLDTHLASAPVSGAPVFEMHMVMAVPSEVSLTELRKALERLCNEHNIDWELTAV